MSFGEGLIQFLLAGGSVVAATLVGRKMPYLGALILLFPAKVLATLLFLPDGDKDLLGRFLVALVPGLLAVAAFALVAKWALANYSIARSVGIGLVAWAIVAGGLALIARV